MIKWGNSGVCVRDKQVLKEIIYLIVLKLYFFFTPLPARKKPSNINNVNFCQEIFVAKKSV